VCRGRFGHLAGSNNILGRQRPPRFPDPIRGGTGADGRTTGSGGEARLRKACSALAVSAVLAIAALITSTASIAATVKTARSGLAPASQVAVTITRMTPQWATPKATITVSGIVTNQSREPITRLSVQLLASSQAFSSAGSLQAYLAGPAEIPGSQTVGQLTIPGTLQPGHSTPWLIHFRAKAAGMTAFGVYPLAAVAGANVQGSAATPGYGFTLLPYVPAKHGAYAHSAPAPRQIAWAWPLIDTPLISLPDHHNDCSGPQVTALRASLEPGGRLATLLAEGVAFGRQDQLTWVVDPALLSDVRALSHCTNSPVATKAAASWLATLQTSTASEPMFATPYADVDLGLISQRDSTDVSQAFAIGGRVASEILHRNLKPPATQTGPGASPAITAMDWPTDGTAGFPTVETLAGYDHIQSMLLDSSVSTRSGTSFLAENGQGTWDHVLLYSDSLNRLLGSTATGPGSEFASAQDFLAETALLAQRDPAGPIVVAPPQRWQPSAGLPAAVLTETAGAPWLSPVTLASLEAHPTGKLTLSAKAGPHAFGRSVVRQLDAINSQIDQLEGITGADEAQGFLAARTALESSAWHGASRQHTRVLLAMGVPLLNYVSRQEQGVSLVLSQRVTLGGLKGDVQVGIESTLEYPIKVKLSWYFAAPPDGGSLHVTQQPQGVITVAPHSEQQVKIHVAAGQVGSSTITVRLVSAQGHPLTGSQPKVVTVQATEFGNLAMIILAAALGLFVIGSGVRAARRGRPSPPDGSGSSGQLDEHPELAAQSAAGTATVVPEHSELGTAGTSGP
jgi:uncharacterized protein DUF6049